MSLLCVMSAITVSAQWSVGMRDNRYVYGQYLLKSHYLFKVEESVFSQKISSQYLRAYVGYRGTVNQVIEYTGTAYYGHTYGSYFYSAGARVDLRYGFCKRLFVEGSLNPHYDSGYGYNTAFKVEAGASLSSAINLMAGYTTIPQFRECEKRVYGGFDFHVGRLCVTPVFSLPAADFSEIKNLRVQMGFEYEF